MSGTEFMKVADMLPSDLLSNPVKLLPFQLHGLGHFRPFDPNPRMMVSAKDPSRVPSRQTPGAAGFDLKSSEDATVPPRGTAIVDTGISVALPSGYYGRIAGRSSLAFRHDVTAFEGTIDEDYRGPIKVKLFNHSDTPYNIQDRERIAQMIIQNYVVPNMELVATLVPTARNMGGFGSTGSI
tara:strand:- start:8022 stop:8567 length:546 start_codon:yes stop_codon:yes gene_type:complete